MDLMPSLKRPAVRPMQHKLSLDKSAYYNAAILTFLFHMKLLRSLHVAY